MSNQQSNIFQKFQRLKEEYEAIQTDGSNSKNVTKNDKSFAIHSINNQGRFSQSLPLAQNLPKNKPNYKPSTEVLEEFRSLIQKTSQLTSKGLSIPFNPQTSQKLIINQPTNGLESDDSFQIDEDFNITHSDSDNENENGINRNTAYDLEDNQYQTQSSSIQLQQSEIDKLKLTNQILTRSNIDLRNANKILEIELGSYQTSPLYSQNSIMASQYDDNLAKFILSVKNSLVQSIKSNLQLQEMIDLVLNENEQLANDNVEYRKSYSAMRNDIEYTNRKNAEIQIANEDNTKTLSYLEEDNQKLKEQLLSIQNEYDDLRNEEENMNLLNNSNQKRKQDNDDLVFQLKTTIDNLMKGCSDSSKRKEYSEREIEDSSRSINDCLYSIQEISEEIERKEVENVQIENEIEKMQKVLREKESFVNEINLRFDAIKEEVEGSQRENEELKALSKEKEEAIKKIKDQIALMTNSIKSNLYADDDNDIKEKILIAKIESEQKDKEIEEVIAKYEAIAKQKSDVINNLGEISQKN